MLERVVGCSGDDVGVCERLLPMPLPKARVRVRGSDWGYQSIPIVALLNKRAGPRCYLIAILTYRNLYSPFGCLHQVEIEQCLTSQVSCAIVQPSLNRTIFQPAAFLYTIIGATIHVAYDSWSARYLLLYLSRMPEGAWASLAI